MFHNLKSQRTLDNSTLNLSTLNQNILYITRQVDVILKVLNHIEADSKLQKQVDDYFDEGADSYPGLNDTRTSPQTELEDK